MYEVYISKCAGIRLTRLPAAVIHGIVEHVDEEELCLAVPAGQWMHYGEWELRWIEPICRTVITGKVIPDITRAIMMAVIIRGITLRLLPAVQSVDSAADCADCLGAASVLLIR